jgi:hypothetical protein
MMASALAFLVQAFYGLHFFIRLVAELVQLRVDLFPTPGNMATGFLVRPDALHQDAEPDWIRFLRFVAPAHRDMDSPSGQAQFLIQGQAAVGSHGSLHLDHFLTHGDLPRRKGLIA